jgi:hypothetical protein
LQGHESQRFIVGPLLPRFSRDVSSSQQARVKKKKTQSLLEVSTKTFHSQFVTNTQDHNP